MTDTTSDEFLSIEDPDVMEAILQGAAGRTRRMLADARAAIDGEFGEGFARANPALLQTVFDGILQAVETDRAALWDGEDEDDWDDWDDLEDFEGSFEGLEIDEDAFDADDLDDDDGEEGR